MEIGFAYKTVIWLSVGCQQCKKSNKIKSHQTHIQITDYGWHQCPATNSLSQFCKAVSRSRTNRQKVSKLTCSEATTTFLKKHTIHARNRNNSKDYCSHWLSSMQSFLKEENTVPSVGTFHTNGWTLTSKPVKCNLRCISTSSLTELKFHTRPLTISLLKSTTVVESLMIRMWDWLLPCFWVTWMLMSWLESTSSQVLVSTLRLWIWSWMLSRNTFLVYPWRTILKSMGFIETRTSLSNKRMWRNSLKLCWVCSPDRQQEEKVDNLQTKLVREWPSKLNQECPIWLKWRKYKIQTHLISSDGKKLIVSISWSKSWKRVWEIFKKPSKVLSSWVLLLKICS